MASKFDPVDERQWWLRFVHRQLAEREHTARDDWQQLHRLSQLVADGAMAMLLGLDDEARPFLHRALAWMEGRPDPAFPDDVGFWFPLSMWWEARGALCWLVRAEPAQECFQRADTLRQAAYDRLKAADPKRAVANLKGWMSIALATSLNADAPTSGLDFFERSGLKAAGSCDGPQRAFGLWACRSLAGGGTRDEAYAAKGAAMLRRYLPSRLGVSWSDPEPVLWLKAIYFDSGVTPTPRDTLLKAYEALGIDWPDFVRDPRLSSSEQASGAPRNA